ncbi:IPT/TIG domain-containing protein [Rubrivirga sp.]|uniref:IPT/TIG domain-containing protein n=1 Tax=Rubrivirga sp. TaxID=1885344 RepID=UPI003C707876
MLRLARLGTALTAVALLLVTLPACDFGEGESLFDPDAQTNPAPVVSSVSPTGVVLAGVDVITIEGTNFSATPSDNTVVFDDQQGSTASGVVLEASPTQLRVRVPNLPNPALRFRVAVIGAQDFSNSIDFPLTAAIVPYGELARTEVPFGIAADDDGTLYLSLENEGSAVGITAIAPDGTRSPYFDSGFPWAALARVDGRLFGVRRLRAVFELPEGGRQGVLAAFQPASVSLFSIAGGPDGSVYAGGNSDVIYRIAPDGSSSETVFPSSVEALVSNTSTLYAVSGEAPAQVYAITIEGDGSLGAPTPIATLPAAGSALEVAADGTLYVGLSREEDPVVTVSGGAVEPLYPGVLNGPVQSLAYGAGSQLYMVTAATSSERANVFRIETRRDGS